MKTEKEIKEKIKEFEKEAMEHYLYETDTRKLYQGSYKKIMKIKIELLRWVLGELDEKTNKAPNLLNKIKEKFR